ncbi:MAG: aminotransferase class IV [Gemmatimonadetes bacterium]|nr:aminotransferase class IV [Gemmatimonadota bacterium]
MIVHLNGEYVPSDRAAVPIDDPGFLYGEGVVETLLVRRSRPVFWEEHWSRLCASADALAIAMPVTFERATSILGELVRRNDMADALARIQLSGYGVPRLPAGARNGTGARNGRRRIASQPPRTFLVRLGPAPVATAEALVRGWKIVLSAAELVPFLPEARHTNRLSSVLARREAHAAHAEEAILSGPGGLLLEGTRSHLFFTRDEVLYTPALEAGVRPAVTRDKVLLLARREGLTINEGLHTARELAGAAEIFLAFTEIGIMPVTDVDGRPVGPGRMGVLTQRLRFAYERLVSASALRTPAPA